MLKIVFKTIVAVVLSSSMVGCAISVIPQYGRWGKYSASKPVKFPDFDLFFKGKRQNSFYPGETERRLADVYVFEANNSSERVEVLWSAGTGLIGPEQFSIGGKAYMIEMLGSDILRGGFVDENNIVVWPMEEFEARRSKPWWMFW